MHPPLHPTFERRQGDPQPLLNPSTTHQCPSRVDTAEEEVMSEVPVFVSTALSVDTSAHRSAL